MKIEIEIDTTKEELLDYLEGSTPEVAEFLKADEDGVYGDRIWDAYIDECKSMGAELGPLEFAEEMDNSIGWSWIGEEK